MIKNIYTPVAGALSQEKLMTAIANNLANANTVGFKQDRATFSFLEPEPFDKYPSPIPPANYKVDLGKLMPLRGNEISYVSIADLQKDFSQGPAIETKNKLDLMVEGSGMFSVQTREGVRYTRSGNLSVTAQGLLTSKTGDPILGEKGLIYLNGSDFYVNSQGEVFQGGTLLDRIPLYEFQNHQSLERVGDNYFYYGGSPEEIAEVTAPRLRQGFIEGSNVNPIKSLTSMIIAHRSYEAYQKAVSNFDQMMEKTSNSIGNVRI